MSQAFVLQPGAEAFPGYHLHLPLGRGGAGEVWEAVGPDGKSIALKFMRCRDSAVATRESRSIQAIRRLRHPNLIRIDQVFLQPGYVVIAMELAEFSLMDLLDSCTDDKGAAIPAPEVALYLAEAAAVLDFLNTRQHDQGGRRVAFQHCDVKPSNLLVVAGRVKLADFGLATSTTTSFSSCTRTGTLEFVGPEIFQGQVSDRSDQYALAVSYCLLRSGRLPFADTPKRFLSSYSRPYPDLTMLPAGEQAVVARALAPAPHERWPSCTILMDQLQQIVAPAPRKVRA